MLRDNGRPSIPNKDKQRFARFIHALLSETGMRDVNLADALELSRGWVSRAKAGHYGPWTPSVTKQRIHKLVDGGLLTARQAEALVAKYAPDAGGGMATAGLMFLRPFTDLDGHRGLGREEHLVSRSELQQIYKSFDRGLRFVLLVGPQASGKSSLAALALEQLKETYNGYVLHSLTITDSAKAAIAAELLSINSPDVLLLLEDAHLNPNAVNSLIELLLQEQLYVNCLITSRPSYKHQILWGQRNLLAEIENEKFGYFLKIDTTGPAYRRFIERLITDRVPEGRNLSEGATALILRESGGDLWAVRFLLDGMRGEECDWKFVYASFHEQLRQWNRECHAAASTVVAVAAFSQYELSVPGRFLQQSLDISPAVLQYLTDRGFLLIDSETDLYALPHPSIAKQYYQTALLFPHLWGTIHSNSADRLIARYLLEFDSKRIYEFVRQIRYDPPTMAACLEDERMQELVFTYIHDIREPLNSTGDLISDIALYSSQATRMLLNKRLEPRLMESKLNSSTDLAALAYFIESLPWESKVNWDVGVSKLNQAAVQIGAEARDQKDQRLVYCPFTAAWGSKPEISAELGRLVAESGMPDSAEHGSLLKDAQLCCKSGSVPTVCLKSTFHVPGHLAITIAQLLDQDRLAEVIKSPETTLYQAAQLLSILAWTDRRVFDGIVAKIGVKELLAILNTRRIPKEAHMFLWALQQANPLFFEDNVWPLLTPELQETYQKTVWMQ